MDWTIVGIALGVVSILVSVAYTLKGTGRSPYIQHLSLFSAAEIRFLRALEQAIGFRYRVFGKVRVGDVIDTREELAPDKRRAAFHRICAKHFDFVLCDPEDFSVACVIELNDASHEQKERAQRDAFLCAACDAIGLPILMIRVRHSYCVTELRGWIEAAIAAEELAA